MYFQLEQAYSSREAAIKKCISQVSGDVNNLRVAKSNYPDDTNVLKKLRKEQTKVWLLLSRCIFLLLTLSLSDSLSLFNNNLLHVASILGSLVFSC